MVYLILTAVVAIADRLPVRWYFRYFRTATRLTLQAGTVRAVVEPEGEQDTAESLSPPPAADIHCVLLTGTLDVGGVEAVVGLLARGLPRYRIRCTVACRIGGRMAEELRRDSVQVIEARTDADLLRAITEVRPSVIQVHNVPVDFLSILLKQPIPTIPVVHSMEVYRTAVAWEFTARLAERSPLTVAVSEVVRRHHCQHVWLQRAGRIEVIPNGVPPKSSSNRLNRQSARRILGTALDVENLDCDAVVVCLARYSVQKSIPGLVDAFLLAVEHDPRLRLVVAGGPEDWREFRRADALRRAHPCATRVHLMGNSWADALLAAADVFLLNSFFEGWPISATEAADRHVPLTLSDVGGARELVGDNNERGWLVPNPCGPAELVNAGRCARVRRMAHQSTRDDVAEALSSAARTIHSREFHWQRSLVDHDAMLSRHASALRRALDCQPRST